MQPKTKLFLSLVAICVSIILIITGWIYFWIWATDSIQNHDIRKLIQICGILPPIIVTAWILVKKGIVEP
jgi:hypothetical protein